MANVLEMFDISNITNDVLQQFTGTEDLENIDLSKFQDIGQPDFDGVPRDNFTKALAVRISKIMFADRDYLATYDDPFFVDDEEYGGILEMISIETPEARENSAWKNLENGDKIGCYEVALPTFDVNLYAKIEPWAIPLTIQWSKWKTAFNSRDELDRLTSHIMMIFDRSARLRVATLAMTNRNIFMARKVNYGLQPTNKGIHYIDLVKEYAEESGKTAAYTVEAAHSDPDYLRWVSAKIRTTIDYMRQPTTVFNMQDKLRFISSDDMVVELLADFVNRFESVLQSNTFHEELVNLPGSYRKIAFWQGIGDGSFHDVSSIHVQYGEEEGETSDRSGYIGLIASRYALLHTIKQVRLGAERFEIEDITHYENQHVDRFACDLGQNAVVLIESDWAPTE